MNIDKNGVSAGVVILIIGFGIGLMFSNGTKNLEHAADDMNQHRTMDGMMHDMAQVLEGKTGDAFDKAFLEEMIVHHEGAVIMAQMVLERSERPELRRLAGEIIAAQATEISLMQRWRVEWFTGSGTSVPNDATSQVPPRTPDAHHHQHPPTNSNEDDAVFCTMDAKMCPDGSYVGRQGPSCAFAPCPGE